MFKRPKDVQVTQYFGIEKTESESQNYINEQNFVAKYPGQHSLSYDFDVILEKLNKDSYILDIGCRGGETVKKLQELGFTNSYGTDIGSDAEKKCLENYGKEWTEKYFKIGDIQKGLPFSQKFDFVIFSHTLEHCQKPTLAMRNIFHGLNDNGFLFIAIPTDYEDSVSNNQTVDFMLFQDPTTFFHWIFWESLEDITEYCTSFGFEVVKSEDKQKDGHEHLLWLQKTDDMNLMNPDIDYFEKPYPHWTMDDMFDESFYKGLKEEFPSVDMFDLDDEVMGGRHIIAPNNPNFQKLLDNSKHWSFFHDTFNSEAFLMSTLRMVEQQCHLLDWNIDLDKVKFHDNQVKLENPSVNDLYVYIDFNIAKNGYQREIHTDMNNRVMGFLFYLTDQDSLGGTGGELGIYNFKSASPTDGLSEPEVKNIVPKENFSAWKIDAHNAWHNVPKMEGTDGWRKFVYVAITSKTTDVWKHKNAQWPNQEQYDLFKSLKF
mgnify:CR=1 FL=1